MSYRQFHRALEGTRLPSLRRLSEGGRYEKKRFYSGLPSATPAVQGELFYGVKSSIPAIAYYDRKRKKKINLLFPSSANELAPRLEKLGKPLLAGGTSYSNIYTGGAESARYCIQTMKLRSFRQILSSLKLFFLLAVRPTRLFEIAGYGLLEAAIAFYDFFAGVGEGKSVLKELKFVPTRVLISALLRELIRTRAKMDLARGVPIVHAGFLGYDEQSHRRGPESAFAHWTLKGIDAVIEDIHRATLRSKRLNYQLVVYSDHGQEAAIPFERRFGKSLEESVKSVIANGNFDIEPSASDMREKDRIRARGFFFESDRAVRRRTEKNIGEKKFDGVRIIAMGPLGHIYFSESHPGMDKEKIAEALAKEARIPLVLYESNGRVFAVNGKGRFEPEKSAREILGGDHPLAGRTAEDLVRVCRHPDAGDVVISGWAPDEPPVTFAAENGAHGGPGKEETGGFALIPESMDPPLGEVVRPSDLRNLVFRYLGRKTEELPENTGKGAR